ncbi:DUF2726 domain-containing protein [Aestuariibacter sp. GS-14]|uniref:DUF2726 domain-containing protein n=1 Tax=Aestuariibacter sp. GS-14 TaxID=2590670 RepID=UPI00112B9610|nr:DUF2726 domain-containing protein [Aestuariibacter sp. GS-14]TPV56864.1 DUF2726 domain-containing protein [Aestuariibacter sp. GS-14]
MELAIVLFMLLIVVAIGALKLVDHGVSFPFRKKPQLFTQVEHTFINLLEQAVGREFRIVSRVRLNDLLAVRTSANKRQARQALLRAGSKQLDFVLCRRDDMTPVLAIDLVHKQGKDGYKTQRDWFVTGALDAAGIPHARFKVKSGYSVEEVRECVETKLLPLRKQQAKLDASKMNPPAPTRPTRPVRSSRQTAGQQVAA